MLHLLHVGERNLRATQLECNMSFCTTTVDWWESPPPQKYFLCFPYQNDETPLFYLRKLRVPLALRGSQNPKVLPVRGTLSRVPVVSCQKVPTFVRHLATPKKKIDTSRLPFPHEKNSPPDNAIFPFSHEKNSHRPRLLIKRPHAGR